MPITYGWLIEELNSLTQLYWISPENSDDDKDDSDGDNETEDESVEGYIKGYHTRVVEVIWEKVIEQIHWKEYDDGRYDIDVRTVVLQETIASISNELDAIKISEDMIIAFRYLLDEDGGDIFDTIVEIYDTHGNLDICEYIADSWILDQVKANSILCKLYYYCDQWKKFIEAIWLLLVEKWVRLDDFRKTWELDIHKVVSSFINDIQRLILTKAWYTHVNTTVH